MREGMHWGCTGDALGMHWGCTGDGWMDITGSYFWTPLATASLADCSRATDCSRGLLPSATASASLTATAVAGVAGLRMQQQERGLHWGRTGGALRRTEAH